MNIEKAGNLVSSQIDLAHEPPFTIGPVLVEPALRKLTAGAEEQTVEPKVMQVLVALGREPGAILSRDDLIECCWNGRIVGDASINRVMSLLRSALRDLAGDAVSIETLPKVGYRILLPAHAHDDETPEPSSDAGEAPKRKTPVLAVAAIALALLAGVLGWWLMTRPSTEPLVVVMLPIEASEGVDPLYASGMEAQIRSQLGQSPGMEVRGGESAGQLVADGQSPAEIGATLQADLVLQAELSNSAESVSLTARLIESGSGTEAWSDNLLAAPGTAQFLPLRATREMLAALNRPANPEAEVQVSNDDYALYLTAMGLIKTRGLEQRRAAFDILEGVVARNPDFADGLAGLAKANYLFPYTDDEEKEARRATAFEQAERALELNPRSVDALKVSGVLLRGDREECLDRLQLATQIDPGDAEAWFWYALAQQMAAPNSHDLLQAAVRMVAVDPLWPASWRASDVATSEGDFDLARRIERDVIAASATRQQRILAEARIARIDGDHSEFIRLVRSVEGQLDAPQRRWGFHSQMRVTNILLGLPDWREARTEEDRMVMNLERGILPARSEFEAIGVTPDTFFMREEIAGEAIPLLVRDGRGDELLEYYDALFPTPEAFEAATIQLDAAQQIIPLASPYIVLALREAGRESEARAHIALVEKWVGVWQDAGPMTLHPLLFELNLTMLNGDTDRAIEIVRSLRRHGWPHQLSHIWASSLGLLRDDPLYDEFRELPEVRAVLDPIRAHIARERAEALALGLE